MGVKGGEKYPCPLQDVFPGIIVIIIFYLEPCLCERLAPFCPCLVFYLLVLSGVDGGQGQSVKA